MVDSQISTKNGKRQRLRVLNVGAGVLHLAQAGIVLAMSNGRSLMVTAAFGNGPPGQPSGPLVIQKLFSYRIGLAVFAFLALSAFFHLLVASPWGYPRYRRELAASRNRFRWVEYSLSATLMIVLIAGTVGITDAAALLSIAGLNASMIFFWMVNGVHEQAWPFSQLGTVPIRKFCRVDPVARRRPLCNRCVHLRQDPGRRDTRVRLWNSGLAVRVLQLFRDNPGSAVSSKR